MPLIKTELLIPRVLCIGGKEGEPNDTSGNFKSGQIITVGDLVQIGLQIFTASELLLVKLCADYPNCFKPLPWWYGRTVEEMPTHLKEGGFIFDASQWEYHESGWWYYLERGVIKRTLGYTNPNVIPASLSDYQEYQKQKEGLGMCKEKGCEKVATRDYNGHGYYVCEQHYESLSNYFDEEYK